MANDNIGFMDEEIIELISEKEKELEVRYENEKIQKEVREGFVTINGEEIEFEEKSLLDGRVMIRIPKGFGVMSPEIASIKYPYEMKPSPIFTNSTTTRNISFNYTDTDVIEKDIGEFKDSMKLVMERVYPMATWLEDGAKEVEGRSIGYFEFISQALDANLYNLMFFAAIDGKVLVGAINCIEDEMRNWVPVAKGIMGSLKINDNKS
jgi:hypothetical protein